MDRNLQKQQNHTQGFVISGLPTPGEDNWRQEFTSHEHQGNREMGHFQMLHDFFIMVLMVQTPKHFFVL